MKPNLEFGCFPHRAASFNKGVPIKPGGIARKTGVLAAGLWAALRGCGLGATPVGYGILRGGIPGTAKSPFNHGSE